MAAVEIRDLHKRFGSVNAVNGLSFDVEPGRVTGFLGPNGAGKSTTLRALLGLIRPTAGTATFGDRRYDELDHPSRQVGAVLEDASFHPGRSARNHLRVLAVTGEHPAGRVDEVLAAVGLTDAANRRVKGYSMGMRQRLAIAAALLGDPEVLILDEPTNGLDPPGISWMRRLLRERAAKGRAVLVSSHLLAEVAQSVDDVVIIANGELRGRGTLEEVLGGDDGPATEVRTPLRTHGRRDVSTLLRAELLKLRTTRTFVTLVAVTVVLSLVVVTLTAILVDEFTKADVRELFTFDFSSLFILILGVVGMAGEWRHRTITSSILAAPDRVRLLAAKLLAYGAAGIVLSLVVTVALMAVGSLILSMRDETTLGLVDLADVLWRNLVVPALLGAFGVCIGGLVRNQIVAIVGLLVVAFVLEPTLLALVPDVGVFGPTVGAPNGIIGINPVDDTEDLLAPGIALIVMIGWVGIGFAATAALLRRRDLV